MRLIITVFVSAICIGGLIIESNDLDQTIEEVHGADPVLDDVSVYNQNSQLTDEMVSILNAYADAFLSVTDPVSARLAVKKRSTQPAIGCSGLA